LENVWNHKICDSNFPTSIITAGVNAEIEPGGFVDVETSIKFACPKNFSILLTPLFEEDQQFIISEQRIRPRDIDYVVIRVHNISKDKVCDLSSWDSIARVNIVRNSDQNSFMFVNRWDFMDLTMADIDKWDENVEIVETKSKGLLRKLWCYLNFIRE
jgi:hypothetical protein